MEQLSEVLDTFHELYKLPQLSVEGSITVACGVALRLALNVRSLVFWSCFVFGILTYFNNFCSKFSKGSVTIRAFKLQQHRCVLVEEPHLYPHICTTTTTASQAHHNHTTFSLPPPHPSYICNTTTTTTLATTTPKHLHERWQPLNTMSQQVISKDLTRKTWLIQALSLFDVIHRPSVLRINS